MTNDSPLRVLHLVRSMRVGGLEKVVLDLTRGLHERGVQSYLGCLLDAGEWAGQAAVEGCWEGSLGQCGPVRMLRDLCRFVRANHIDLIHTHNSHPHKYGVPVSLLTGVPLVHTKHGRNWPDNPRWVWFSRQLSRFTRVVVPVSRDIERIVVEIEKVPRRKVRLILNGVDTERFKPERQSGTAASLMLGKAAEARRTRTLARISRGIPEKAFVVGSIGRMSAEKCYPALVRMCASLRAQHPRAFLVIVGDGPARETVAKAVVDSGMAARCLLPGVRSDVAGWLRCFDVFVLSSDQEGTSITLLEAGASGLPCVVTDVGGNGEIVRDSVTGYVVPFGDEGAFVAALTELAGNTGQRVAMGRAGRERIRSTYSLDAMVSDYVEAYRMAVGPAGAPERSRVPLREPGRTERLT